MATSVQPSGTTSLFKKRKFIKSVTFMLFQVGYGARYYSYLLARSVASNIWQKLFRDDPFDPSKGAIFRNKCLSHGGGKPSADIISDLLDQKVEPIDLADALLNEIDEKQQMVQFLGNK